MKKICIFLFISASACVSCGKGVGSGLGASYIGVDQVSISEDAVSFYAGKTKQLYSAVDPANAHNTSVRWETSDPLIVTVSDSGLLTGVSAGTAVVTVTAAGDVNKSAQCDVTIVAFPVINEISDAGSVTYTLPGGTVFKVIITSDTASGIRFPESANNGSYPVPEKFCIAETETTYELWKEVYDWAVDPERGDKIYTFANPGVKGGYRGGTVELTEKNPVTSVNWRDSIAWCNALTEYYNANNSTSDDLECVYTYNGSIVRDSRDANASACDAVVQNTAAKGFRLPSIFEWEFAERYIGPVQPSHSNYEYMDGLYYTKSGSVCGYTGNNNDGYADDYAVTISRTTSEVKSKKPNLLGLYDMSGNVWEWCFDSLMIDENNIVRYLLSGSFRDTLEYAYVGYESMDYPTIVDLSYGFRISKNSN